MRTKLTVGITVMTQAIDLFFILSGGGKSGNGSKRLDCGCRTAFHPSGFNLQLFRSSAQLLLSFRMRASGYRQERFHDDDEGEGEQQQRYVKDDGEIAG